MTARTPAFRRPPADHAILSEMNITPLIDVLLVLPVMVMVMLILTVPVMTHEVPIDIGQGKIDPRREVKTHRVDLAANGTLAWDGTPVADAALPARLAAYPKEDNAVLHIQAAPDARYRNFTAPS